nr:MAG TPA: Regulatory protein-modification, helix-turn-helix, transcriptional regulator, DNA [Caudoviricetes sp.]
MISFIFIGTPLSAYSIQSTLQKCNKNLQKVLTLVSENVIMNLQKCKKEVITMATNIPELKAECARHGVTLEELASRIGVNNATLYRKMTGKSEFYRNELQVIRDVLCLNDDKFLLIFLITNLQKRKKSNRLTKWRWR